MKLSFRALLHALFICSAGSLFASQKQVAQLYLSVHGEEYRCSYSYDVSGHVQQETCMRPGSGEEWEYAEQTEWLYQDERCVWQIRRTYDEGAWKSTDEIEWNYNRVGDLLDEYTYQYDAQGVRRLVKYVKMSYPNQGKMRQEYAYQDDVERLALSVTEEYADGQAVRCLMETYDDNGALATTFTYIYTYDASGRQTACRTEENNVPLDSTTWHYDEQGRVLSQRVKTWNADSEMWENTQLVDYAYTDDGNISSEVYMLWGGEIWENVCRYVHTYDEGKLSKRSLQSQLYREWRDLMSIHYSDFAEDRAGTISSEYEFWGGTAGEAAATHIPFDFNGEPEVRYAENIRLEYEQEEQTGTRLVNATVLKAYPNPSDGVFYIDVNGQGISSWEVYDMRGKRVKSQTSSCFTGVVDITGLEQGVYLLRVATNDGYLQQKLIKK